MDATTSLNDAMRYIERHLFDEIDFAEVARLACCSEYQFRRMISYLADMSLHEYIRKRRLSVAAELVQTGGRKIIDIALQCGYESPDAFGKAFQAMYGVSPSALRKNPSVLKTFPPLFFHLTLKGGIAMEYRVVERNEFYLMGKTGIVPLIYHGPNPHMADVWKKLSQSDLLVLMEYAESEPRGVLSVCGQTIKGTVAVQEGEDTLYCVGVVMEKPMPDRFKGRFDVVPFDAATWLVFPTLDNARSGNAESAQQMYARIAEWLPTSEYEETGAPSIMWSETYDFSKPDKKGELWFPVRKRG